MKKSEALTFIEGQLTSMRNELIKSKVSDKAIKTLLVRVFKEEIRVEYILDIAKTMKRINTVFQTEVMPVLDLREPEQWAYYELTNFEGRETIMLDDARKLLKKAWASQPKFVRATHVKNKS